MSAAIKFKFRPVLTLCAGLALAVLLSLGNWQLQRLEWKRALIEQVETRAGADPISLDAALSRAAAGDYMEYTSVKVRGVYADGDDAKVFGALEGAPGYFLFSPLMRSDKGAEPDAIVFINRGFVPQGADLPVADNEQAAFEVTGLLRYPENPAPPAAWFLPKEKSGDGFWLVRDPVLFSKAAGMSASAYYIDSFSSGRDGIPKGGVTRLDFNNRHLEYALTWLGLAGALIAVWLTASFQRRP